MKSHTLFALRLARSLRILVVTVLFCTAGSTMVAGEAEDVYTTFRSNYIDGGKVALQFQDAAMSALSGELILGDGEKFRLDLGARIVICDGKNVWNYDSLGNKVVINEYKTGRGVLTPAGMFRLFEQKGTMSLSREATSDGERMLVLTWQAQNAEESAASLQKVVLHLDENSLQPLEVNATDGITQFHWLITSVRKLPALDPGMFTFTPDESTRTIDLR